MVITNEFQPDTARADRHTLRIALAANFAMFVVGLVGWRIAHSTALLADAFDMLADAAGFAVAHWAVGRSKRAQENAARWNAGMNLWATCCSRSAGVAICHKQFRLL